MSPNPLDASSFAHRFVSVPTSGHRYHLVDQPAEGVEPGKAKATLLLCHGWPDLWYGWRYQIVRFVAAGYRVLCPSQLGYGESSRPEYVEAYTFKHVTRDMKELLDVVGIPEVVVIGHDWGGMVAWRFADYYPERVKACLSVCTPYLAPASPTAHFIPLEDLIRTALPNFGYQLFLTSNRAAPKIEGVLEQFLASSFSKTVKEVRRAQGQEATSVRVKEGELEEAMDGLLKMKKKGALPDVPSDPEYSYSLDTYRSTGLRHCLNWYHTREPNFRHEQADRLAERPFPPHIPALLISATEDAALPLWMAQSEASRKPFEVGGNLRLEVVEGADHWDVFYRDKVNDMLGGFVEEVLSSRWKPEKKMKL